MARQNTTLESPVAVKAPDKSSAKREAIFDAFRRWGYLESKLDPLGNYEFPAVPELGLTGKDADEARAFYCGTIGTEFMHIPDQAKRAWVAQRMESDPPQFDQARILDRLVRAEIFEQVLQTRYLGTKRYSLEGNASLIPLLDEVFNTAAERGVRGGIIAMSHRGRLNVMVHTVGRDAAAVFARFEDVDPRSVLGSGDVKYHLGATGEFQPANGRTIDMHLVSNPSHLEAVDPVAMGRTLAKQVRANDASGAQYLPVLLHGDAAFAGQGIWAETLNFAGLEGYNVGGSIHIIVNNLIGFTTVPRESHTSFFSSDLAKRIPIPIFHVNAEDPDAVSRVGRMAVEYRYEFGTPVIIDLIGYRRHGHSEVDDPTITQPLRYKKIQEHPPLWQIYAKEIGVDAEPTVEKVRQDLDAAQKAAEELEKNPVMRQLPDYWKPYRGGRYNSSLEVETAVSAERLSEISAVISSYPSGFHIHPKVKKLLEQRAEMGQGKRAIDYGMAETLAFGALLREGTPVRLSGQDSRRGTFNQRHAALIDIENEEIYIPLSHVSSDQARFDIYNSALSEASIMGFEYGYSRDYPETLTLWEAQFGDFANGAQIIIDQFLAAGEDKWNLLSGLVLLLPHGYEGQGPEHSSARIERYLQLAARDNIQIAQPSTAGQYFHLLRRQALRTWRKPLIVFTPKSMLRHPAASSSLNELTEGRFLTVIPDVAAVENVTRLLVCTGKIGHELAAERKKRNDSTVGIIFVEQLYPFPEAELTAEFERHPNAREVVWVQEEPANMGALAFVLPRLERAARGKPVRSVKRSASASPATGSHGAHEMEQHTLISLAFATGSQQK